MGREPFSSPITDSTGNRVRASQNAGTLETDNYQNHGSFSVGDGTNTYNHLVDPDETIQALYITEIGADITMEVTSEGGDVETWEPRGAVMTVDELEIGSVTFKDPDATGAVTKGFWIGE